MSAKQKLNDTSKGLRIASNWLLLLGILGIVVDCWNKGRYPIDLHWGLTMSAAIFLRFIWACGNAFGQMVGVGCLAQEQKKAEQRIQEDERRRGKAPSAWSIPWFGNRRMGGDVYGMYLEEPDGTRRRDI